jgi:Domain of unknown function (DUF4340)
MKKNLYILVGVLAVLVVIAYFLMNRPGEADISTANSQLLVVVDSLTVDKIEITSPANKVVLAKKGGEWFLIAPVDYRANQSSVTAMIHQLKNLTVKEIVSTNPGKRQIFQVDSTGTLVKIFQGGQEHAAIVVGKRGQNFAETYVRKEELNDVAIVDGSLTFAFNKAVKDWRDKTVVNVPKESITTISYQYPGETYSLALQDSVWMIGDNKPKAAEVTSLLTALSHIDADDFVDSAITPVPKISATVNIGDVQLRFSEVKDKDKYLLQSSNSPQWFEIQGWHAKQLLKHKKDLI